MSKSIGSKILELIPEGLQEDLIKEIKAQLIEKGEVVEAVKPKELTADQKTEIINKVVDSLM